MGNTGLTERLRRLLLRRLAVALGLAAVLLCWTAPGASAHAWLVDVTPSDGASSASSLHDVRLRFSEPVTVPATQFVVQHSDGRTVARQASSVSGQEIELALPGALDGGVYVVRYRAICSSGHVLTGTSTFTVAGPPSSRSMPSTTSAQPLPHSSAGSPRTGGFDLVALAVAVALVALALRQLWARRGAGLGAGIVAVTATAFVTWAVVPLLTSTGSGPAATAATAATAASASAPPQRLKTRNGGTVSVSIGTDRRRVSAQLTVADARGHAQAPVAVAELTAPGTVLPPVRLPLQQLATGSLYADAVALPDGGHWQLALTLTHADGAVERLTTPVEVP